MLAPHLTTDSLKLGEVVAASEQTKIEIWSHPDAAGNPTVELVESAWGAGLGWYVRKRMSLDAGQVELLTSLLGTIRPPAPAPCSVVKGPLAVREDNVIHLLFPAA
jgi:hypothetical protein